MILNILIYAVFGVVMLIFSFLMLLAAYLIYVECGSLIMDYHFHPLVALALFITAEIMLIAFTVICISKGFPNMIPVY